MNAFQTVFNFMSFNCNKVTMPTIAPELAIIKIIIYSKIQYNIST